jgi:NAD(P)-dependent dehydrogenase (short-subunit alcohol dehydrogenase family)
MVATTLPVFGSTTTDELLQPEKIRFEGLSYAMPVGPSHGASGHEAVAFHVLTSIVDEAVRNSGAAYGIAADLGTEAGARAVIAQFPSVDILVNNLGIFEPKPFEQITDDDWRRFFEVNVMSGVRLSRHYIGPMKRNNWGRIIFISSESALQIPVEMIHYGMTKTAQLAISRGLAETTTGTAVTVNAVLPGSTESEGVVEFVKSLATEKVSNVMRLKRSFSRRPVPPQYFGASLHRKRSRLWLRSLRVHWHPRSTERQFGSMAAWFVLSPE